MHNDHRPAIAFVWLWSFAAVLAILGHVQIVPGRLKLVDLVDVPGMHDGAGFLRIV